jgi:hypothetical protein
MNNYNAPHFRAPRAWLSPVLLLTLAASWPAFLRAEDTWDWTRQSLLPANLDSILAQSGPVDTTPRPAHIRLFGMTTAFLSDPVGLDQDDFNPANPGVPVRTPGPTEPDNGPDWITLAIGNDNPYFELRMPGDPGGVGFYRLASQVQVLDSSSTTCAIGLQAFTPAGLQQGGASSGPTMVCPNLALCQQIGDGAAIHGFVGENIHVDPRNLGNQVKQGVQCGVAVHQPLFPELPDRTENVYLFVQALGRLSYETAGTTPTTASTGNIGQQAVLQVLPGLQWKASDNLWWSSGVVMPVGPARPGDTSHLQITCSFQF